MGQAFVQPGLTDSGTGSTLDPQNATAFSVTITDPDAPDAKDYSAINFDGDETITVHHQGATLRYNLTFEPPSSYTEGSSIRASELFTGTDNSRSIPRTSYRQVIDNTTTAFLLLPRLEEVRKAASTAQNTGNFLESVRLLDVYPSGTARALQLVGKTTNGAGLPISGSQTFVGESYGRRNFPNGALHSYVGDTVLTVDYATRVVIGEVTISQYVGPSPSQSLVTVRISGVIADDGTLTGNVTASGVDISETGYLTGAMYGPAGDELGFVFFSSGGAGSIFGGRRGWWRVKCSAANGMPPIADFLKQHHMASGDIAIDDDRCDDDRALFKPHRIFIRQTH